MSIRLPAEWEPHAATHLAWPTNSQDWPGKFHAARWAMAEFIRRLAEHELVRLAVPDAAREARARHMLRCAGIPQARVEYIRFDLDRGWMRDISPAFVFRNGRKAAVRFAFTGWAKYDNYRRDAQWPKHIISRLKLPALSAVHRGRTVCLEGGAIDGNGCGALLTTEECLLDDVVQPRNPGFSKEDYEAVFSRFLGVEQTIWLGKGILGDDTHGHVDDICRFVSRDTVVLARTNNPRDSDYAALEENRERLEGAVLSGGGKIQIARLPMPEPLTFRGMRLPASYANFYIANGVVLAPTFNDPGDRIALGVLAELFPDRKVIGIHAVDLVWGFGTLHCLSHEEPAGPVSASDAGHECGA